MVEDNNTIGIIAGLILTVGMIALYLYSHRCPYNNIEYGPKGKPPPQPSFLGFLELCAYAAVWYSVPCAWMKGIPFDATVIVLFMMIFIPAKITGVFQAEPTKK